MHHEMQINDQNNQFWDVSVRCNDNTSIPMAFCLNLRVFECLGLDKAIGAFKTKSIDLSNPAEVF